jgi:predicted Zn-dependent protease
MKHDEFLRLADDICVRVAGADHVSLYVAAEASDFLRFNHAAVRQATHVDQRHGTVSVAAGKRRASAACTLSGDPATDRAHLLAERDRLVAQLPEVPEDPFLLLPAGDMASVREEAGQLPRAADVIAAVARHAQGTDLVGFCASGPVMRGYADSNGQRHWHSVASFNFDWCLYRAGDEAVKTSYAGRQWDADVFAAKMDAARKQLALLERPRRTLSPGAYRAYFTPVAVADLLGTLSWGGFAELGVRTGVSSLIKLHRGESRLHPAVHLDEATADGLAPRFTRDGFTRPDRVTLVAAGAPAGTLVSPRTAREFGGDSNSGPEESPSSLAMRAGDLPPSEVFARLGTGLYVSDLHYLNYSDRQACRVTGMTRFACLWVEDGMPIAPLHVMRFDDSLLRMFGDGLVALTSQPEPVPDSATYGSRQLSSVTAPGALVDGFVLTL